MTKAGLMPLRTEKELIPFLEEGDKHRGAANRKCTVGPWKVTQGLGCHSNLRISSLAGGEGRQEIGRHASDSLEICNSRGRRKMGEFEKFKASDNNDDDRCFPNL